MIEIEGRQTGPAIYKHLDMVCPSGKKDPGVRIVGEITHLIQPDADGAGAVEFQIGIFVECNNLLKLYAVVDAFQTPVRRDDGAPFRAGSHDFFSKIKFKISGVPDPLCHMKIPLFLFVLMDFTLYYYNIAP